MREERGLENLHNTPNSFRCATPDGPQLFAGRGLLSLGLESRFEASELVRLAIEVEAKSCPDGPRTQIYPAVMDSLGCPAKFSESSRKLLGLSPDKALGCKSPALARAISLAALESASSSPHGRAFKPQITAPTPSPLCHTPGPSPVDSLETLVDELRLPAT